MQDTAAVDNDNKAMILRTYESGYEFKSKLSCADDYRTYAHAYYD